MPRKSLFYLVYVHGSRLLAPPGRGRRFYAIPVVRDGDFGLPCTVETAYKVAICPSGYLLYMGIYLIADQKLLWRDILGLYFINFVSDFTV